MALDGFCLNDQAATGNRNDNRRVDSGGKQARRQRDGVTAAHCFTGYEQP